MPGVIRANTITISNNTVFQNKQGGMVIGGSLEGNDILPGVAENVTVTNNIVVDNTHFGISELGRAGVNFYSNNLLYGNTGGGYDLVGGGVPSGTVTADPQFINYQAVDLNYDGSVNVFDLSVLLSHWTG